MDKKQLNEQLFAAVTEGKVEEAKMLIESGANVNVIDQDGDTPLHFAVEKEFIESSKTLVRHHLVVNFVMIKPDFLNNN